MKPIYTSAIYKGSITPFPTPILWKGLTHIFPLQLPQLNDSTPKNLTEVAVKLRPCGVGWCRLKLVLIIVSRFYGRCFQQCLESCLEKNVRFSTKEGFSAKWEPSWKFQIDKPDIFRRKIAVVQSNLLSIMLVVQFTWNLPIYKWRPFPPVGHRKWWWKVKE